MIIAVASGKGGTGKTTIATNLAKMAPDPVVLMDCDVEAPNTYLFLNSSNQKENKFHVFVPEIERDTCTLCRKCVDICQFNALAAVAGRILVFPELCHSCLGCQRICPEKAVLNTTREVGTIHSGQLDHIYHIYGKLKIGEAMAPPLIRQMIQETAPVHQDKMIIIDAPPGTSCPMVTAIQPADFVLLVTEPTPFGFHDLKLAVDVVKFLGLPHGVVINRCDTGTHDVMNYCLEEKIPVMLQIPESREVAEAYAAGKLMTDISETYQNDFKSLYRKLILQNKPCMEITK